METVTKLRLILSRTEKRGLYGLIALTFVVGLLDMAGVASIFPFMAVLADPGSIERNALLSWLFEALEFQSIDSFLIFLGIGAFVVVMASIGAQILALYAIAHFGHMRAYSLSTRLLGAYLRQPYAWFLNRHSADLAKSILSEVDSVINKALMPALRLISGLFVSLLIVILLVAMNPIVALGAAGVLVLAYTTIFLTARRSFTRFGEIRFEANEQRYRISQEALGGIKDVKLLGIEDTYVGRFQKPARRMARANTIQQVLGDAPRFVLQGIAFGGMLLVILYLLLSGNQNISDILPLLAVYAFAGLRLLPALQLVYNQFSKLRFGKPAVDALFRDMSAMNLTDDGAGEAGRAEPLRVRERIELVDIHYAYPQAERQALVGLSLTVPAHTTVGIVGGTGAGKTTAVDVMLGLLEPQSGALRVDGRTVDRDNLRAWQSTIGYVPQHIFLTDDSVAANIAFGVPPRRIDRAAVERAARIAELHDFVTSELPEGYDTFVGERGVRLSGGQRQRIGIARALYHDPDVLIMDEATSALDNLTERAVMDAVHNLGRAKTIVLIAHRLSTVRGCDTIFMLDHGQLVAQGPYESLIEKSNRFRALAVGEA